MANEKVDVDINKMSFEEALAELEKISEKMSQGGLPLETAVDMYARGAKLRARCSELLKAAEEKVKEIDASLDGSAPDEEDSSDGEPSVIETMREDDIPF